MKSRSYYKLLLYSILSLLLGSITPSFAQELSYQQFTVEDGLPSNQVYCIHQDNDGYIWLGTENGLSRYDGHNFVNYTVFDGLPDTEILYFKEDSQERLWFHTLNGKIGYYKDGNFYSEKNKPFLKEAFLGNVIYDSIEDEEGNLYFVTSDTICKIGIDNSISKKESPYPAYRIVKDKKGHLYLNHIGNKSGDFFLFPEFKPVNIALDAFDEANLQKLIQLRIVKPSEIYAFGKSKSNLIETHNTRVINEADKYWVFGVNTPLQIFSKTGDIEKIYHNDDINVSKGFVDKDKNIWLGSLGKGVFLFSPSASYQYNKNTNLKGSVFTSLYVDKQSKNIYCGSTEGDLNIISNKGIQHFQLELDNKLSFPRIRSINKDRYGKLWVVCDSHLEKIDEHTGEQEVMYLRYKNKAFISPKSIFMLKEANVFFIAKAFGADRITYDETSAQRIPIFDKRSSQLHVDDKQTLWLGTGIGLYYSPNLAANKDFTKLDFDDPISTINHVDSTLVVGTKGKGLLLITGDKIKRLSKADGLASNLIRAVYVADNKSVWIATNKGLNKCENIANDPPTFTTITKQNGLVSNDVVDCGIMDNTLYVLCSQGLSEIPLVNIKDNFSAPKIKLETIKVNNKIVPRDSIRRLASHQNNLFFQFSSIYFGNRDNLQYYYKLDGYHQKWQETKSNYLLFEKLPPQKYTLEIRTSPHDYKDDNPTFIEFEIVPAFYQRKPVQILGALLLGLLLWYITRAYFIREQEKSKIEKRLLQLEQIALQSQMNPHFIKNSLGAIQHLMIKKDVRTANKYLTVFGELITQLLRQSDQSKIKVIDEIKILELYLNIEKLRFDNNFKYTINSPSKEILDKKIPSMMIQPLVENAILHGFKDSSKKGNYLLNLSFVPKGEYLHCRVSDNGLGIDEPIKASIVKKQGLAIKNIKERISLLAIKKPKTAFDIVKTDKDGTEIKLCLPLEEDND